MQTWEYRTVYVNTELAIAKAEEEIWDSGSPGKTIKFKKDLRNRATLERVIWLSDYLNKLGKEGWELVTAYGMYTGTPFLPQYLMFKRPRSGAE